jgi:hypothetical protein
MELEIELIRPTGPEVSKERMLEILGRVQWCCQNRHGALNHVPASETREVGYTLTYYYGCRSNKGAWWTKNRDGTYSVEFAHQTKVYPPPNKPWRWCGKTILFEDWMVREHEEEDAANNFRVGDIVSFTHKGVPYAGTIIGGRKRATVLVGSTKWYVPYTDLS